MKKAALASCIACLATCCFAAEGNRLAYLDETGGGGGGLGGRGGARSTRSTRRCGCSGAPGAPSAPVAPALRDLTLRYLLMAIPS